MSKFKVFKRFAAGTVVGAAAGSVVGFEGSPYGLKRQAARDGAFTGALVGGLLGAPVAPLAKTLAAHAKVYGAGASITKGSKLGKVVRFIRVRGRVVPIRAK